MRSMGCRLGTRIAVAWAIIMIECFLREGGTGTEHNDINQYFGCVSLCHDVFVARAYSKADSIGRLSKRPFISDSSSRTIRTLTRV
jgi:hypothetical protein